MDIFAFDWISFFIVGIGTMLLVGELLVNTKGIFGILGFISITLYFYAYLDPSMFWIMVVIYFIGIILIFIDGQFVNDGALAAVGAVLMLISVGVSSPNWVVGLYAIIGVIIGGACSFLWLKVLPRRNMWSKIALLDRLTDDHGYSSMNIDYRKLINQKGVALTNLRPIGTVKIDGIEYSAISNGFWIEKNTEIIVKQVDGTRILVEPVNKNQDERLAN